MTWPSRFLAVPVSRLRIAEELAPTDKASSGQLRSYVRNVPEIYAHLRNGVSPAQFEATRAEGAATVSRELSDTYHHFFAPAGRDGRIEADYINGDLVVTRGRHRVDMAQREGISYIPVHVRARSSEVLAQVTAKLESGLARNDPAIVKIQRGLDEQHHAVVPTRSSERVTSSAGGSVSFEAGMSRRKSPEFEPQPQLDRTTPDRDRAERALGALATSRQVQSPEATRQDRITRALGHTATEAAREVSRMPNRDRS